MRIFITGITGTLGRAVLADLICDEKHHIVGYSRDEKKQSEIPTHERLTLILGDVRDSRRVIESSRDCELILHFAALKRVDVLEANPEESIQTNIEGTINVLGAQRANKIPRVVLSSTDKACKPINVYGNCKALAEKLVLRNKNNVVVRYGNVLASRGSAVLDFINTLEKSGSFNLTHKEMTRFFMQIEDAAGFVIDSALRSEGGLRIYDKMKACKIVDLIDVIAECVGTMDYGTNVVGMRPGEKLHEDLFHEFERGHSLTSKTAPQFSRTELKALIEPIVMREVRRL